MLPIPRNATGKSAPGARLGGGGTDGGGTIDGGGSEDGLSGTGPANYHTCARVKP